MSTKRGLVILMLLIVTACGTSGQSQSDSKDTSGQKYPDVVRVRIEPEGGGTFSLSVTIRSPYDTPERYADGWRVLAPDGRVLAKHTLTHDHAEEQPFTRTQSAVKLPAETRTVTVEGRDKRNGYGGKTVQVAVP